MGIKEDHLVKRVLFGYAGQLRPMQVVGGPCTICQTPLWIDLPEPLEVLSTSHQHFSCHNFQRLEIDRQLFPWGVRGGMSASRPR